MSEQATATEPQGQEPAAPAPPGQALATVSVHTYRGRRLEDILPQIRAELGPDAVILREREGLVGGVGGFFAQRFIEVQARRGGPSIDLYDEDEPEDDLAPPEPNRQNGASAADVTVTPPEPAETVGAVLPNAVPDEFMSALRAAASAWTEDDAGFDEPEELPAVERALTAPAATEPPGGHQSHPPVPVVPQPVTPAAELSLNDDHRPVPATVPGDRGTAPPPIATTAPSPPSAGIPQGSTPPHPSQANRQGLGRRLRTGLSRGRPATAPPPAPRFAPGQPLDDAAAALITRELVASGAGEALARRLIADAAAHGSPFARHQSLRNAARAQLAQRIIQPPALQSAGAAIAFVGGGGSGKTSCVASLASAYARASTLPVSAIALAPDDGGRRLSDLLRADQVRVTALQSRQAQQSVQDGRRAGLVVIDTVAVSPGDDGAMRALAGELVPLALDAVYVALPATLSPSAARGALAHFAALGPTALVITHADETDQIGTIVERGAQPNPARVYPRRNRYENSHVRHRS